MAALLIITAVLEAATALLLLTVPALVVTALFGWGQPPPEALVVARVAGAAVLSIAVASWTSRRAAGSAGVVTALLTYNAVVAAVFAYAGALLRMTGWLLWPAVLGHCALGAWCIACARGAETGERR